VRLGAAGAAALSLVPAAARADQYVVDHCSNVDTGAPAVGFPAITGPTASTCGSQGGGLHVQTLNGMVPAHASETIRLAIPADRPNIKIERIITHFAVPAETPASPAGAAFMPMQDGFGAEIFNSRPPDSPTVDRTLAPGDRSVAWNVFCTAASPCSFTDEFVLHVFATRLYLDEGVAPALTVTGGRLAGPGAKTGLQSLGFDAADTDSGVSSVSIALDATTVATLQFPCAFDDWSACPRSESSQVLQADTTKVPDGDHELFVTARDAADNAVTRSLGTVTVANGPASLPNGSNPSRLARISARFATTTRRSRTLRLTSAATVKGALVNETGKPISGATVAVLARPRQSSAATAQIATATTGADGTYAVKVPGGPSRTISFAYTAFSNDARPAATATLRTSVRARISARIAPRAVRPGKSITLTGRLALLPRKGVEIKIQARQGSAWRTIDAVRTTRTGTFRWRYRFATRQARRTYEFRAHVASAAYPFAAASSRPARVRVV
jgi:hypothetical protein